MYKNARFNEKNPYGFTYNLQYIVPEGSMEIPYSFGPGQQQGASIDYLLSLTSAALHGYSLSAVTIPSNCLNIGASIAPLEETIRSQIREGTHSPFIDLKRTGDGDQGDGAFEMNKLLKHVVLGTGDRLLFTMMRLMKFRCILQYHQTLTIFRGTMPVAMTEEQVAAYKAAKKARFIAQYTENYNIFTHPEMPKVLAIFISSIKLPETPLKLVVTVVTLLAQKVESLITLLTGFGRAVAGAALPIVPIGQPAEEHVITMITICQSVGVSRSDISSFLQMFTKQFDYKKDYPLIKYSFKPYKALSAAIRALHGKLTSTRPERAPVNYFTLADKEGGYNKSLLEILNSMPPSAAGPPLILDSQTTRDAVGPIIASLRTDVMVGGRRGQRQRGGGLEDSRAFLFREICSVAATYIKVTLSPHIQHTIKLSVLHNTIRAYRLAATGAQAAIDAANIEHGNARQYFPTISPANIEATIEAQTHVADAERDLIIPALLGDAANAIAKLEEIQFLWVSASIENESHPHDPVIWWQLLNPFSDDSRTINGGHIFYSEHLQRDPLAHRYISGFIDIPEIPSLLTLAIINDMLEGAVWRQTSIFTQLFVAGGLLPRSIGKLQIQTPPQWDSLQNLVTNVYRSVSTGRISREILTLFGGHRRKTRRRSKRRKTLRR